MSMEYVEIDIDAVLQETAEAILVSIGNDEIWIPKSQIDDYDDSSVSLAEWLAYEKGLI